jgi:hypothetical protein
MRIVSAMEFPDCDPTNPETLSANLNGKYVTAKDCAALAEAFATAQHEGWSTVQPHLVQTRVEANHDGLIDQAGDQISTIILDVVEAARANP